MATTTQPEILMEGHGLEKRYGGVVALTDVDFRLAAGEILGLVGPNGAGKTTLVDCISGIQTANAGTLTLRGVKLTGPASRRSKAGLARTFQYPQLALDLTVGENLLMGRAVKRHGTWRGMIWEAFRGAFLPGPQGDGDAVLSIAKELQIKGLDRLAGDLTLGEQRLVEVGRALGEDPLVLLLDEPFAGSDPSGIAGIIEVIRTIQQRGHGIILVDHNVDLVSSLVDRIMLLDRGRVVFDGDPQECLTSAEMQEVYFGGRSAAGRPAAAARPRVVADRPAATPSEKATVPNGATSATGERPAATELQVDELSVRYGRALALRNVSIVAQGGTVTAVVGPNGAGKSSLLLAIYGSVASQGGVALSGEDISKLRPIARARLGVANVPQGRQLFPRMNVRENLQVMAEAQQLPASRVDEALDRFPILRERARSLAGVLSGGEQQMLVVSRALMGSPRVLLLDEMMTGLAPRIVDELSETVLRLAREDGVAVLLAEPSIHALESIIDRGYVVIRGSVETTVETGGADLDQAYQRAMGVEMETIQADVAQLEHG